MNDAHLTAPPDAATVQALRQDLALQLARCIERRAVSQVTAAKSLGIPQPTLSKIMNGKVSELSLELLIRIAVRAGLPVVLQTGQVPEEAGAFVTSGSSPRSKSRVAEQAREALLESARRLTPEQRLAAHVEHSKLMTALHHAGQRAPRSRDRMGGRTQ